MDNAFFDRTLTALDHARLQGMLARALDLPAAGAGTLAELLDAADIVPSEEVPRDVATMRSKVLLCDARSGEDFQVMLHYPAGVDAVEDASEAGEVGEAKDGHTLGARVNVLTPIGLALLGSKVGDDLSWQGATGAATHARFKAMVYQPEAAGDWLD